MKRLAVAAVLALILVFSMVGLACQKLPSIQYCPKSVQETVVWTMLPWLSLSINQTLTDLGNVSCSDTKEVLHANFLTVRGNVNWQINVAVSGPQINGHCPNYYLSISLEPPQGTASQLCQGKKVWIDYHLRHLGCLPPGNYLAIVEYTVSAP